MAVKKEAIRFDYNNMMSDYVGTKGITVKDLSANKEKAKKAFAAVKAGRGQNMMGWTELAYNQKEVVDDIIATAKEVRRKVPVASLP